MRRTFSVLILLGLAVIALPMTVAALGLDVEAKAGAGIGLGATDNPDITGAARIAADGGVNVDVYLLDLGSADLGISVGAEYSYLTFHSVWSNLPSPPFPAPGIDQTTDATYGYFNLPISLVCKVPVSEAVQIVIRGGGFIGYFLGGSADLTYSSILPDSTSKLDSSTTILWEYGLHFTAGADIALGGGLSLAPAVQFNMGLTDTSKNTAQAGTFKDTFWSLTAIVGIKYKVL
jgi:hypothetical protein